jgi:putative endonuclease
MLHCNGGFFYVGHTENLEKRIAQHETGALPGFTRDHLPVAYVWSEEFATRYEAQTAEQKLKGWSRAKKLALIRGSWNEISRLSRNRQVKGQAFDRLRPGGSGDG